MKKTIILTLVISIFQISVLSANACPCKGPIKKTGGVLSGLVVGPMVGMVRGFGRGQKLGTDFIAHEINGEDSSFGRGISFLTGGLVNGAFGAGAGLIKGGYEGIHYGYSNPYSKESYGLTGKSFTDYPLLSN